MYNFTYYVYLSPHCLANFNPWVTRKSQISEKEKHTYAAIVLCALMLQAFILTSFLEFRTFLTALPANECLVNPLVAQK